MINQGRENEEAEKTVFSAQKLTEVIFGLSLSQVVTTFYLQNG